MSFPLNLIFITSLPVKIAQNLIFYYITVQKKIYPLGPGAKWKNKKRALPSGGGHGQCRQAILLRLFNNLGSSALMGTNLLFFETMPEYKVFSFKMQTWVHTFSHPNLVVFY